MSDEFIEKLKTVIRKSGLDPETRDGGAIISLSKDEYKILITPIERRFLYSEEEKGNIPLVDEKLMEDINKRRETIDNLIKKDFPRQEPFAIDVFKGMLREFRNMDMVLGIEDIPNKASAKWVN